MRGREPLRAVGTAVHDQIARARWSAALYLNALSLVARRLPDTLAKRRLLNLLTATHWPDMAFRPQDVVIAPGTSIRVIPHSGEVDFKALFCRALDYEPGVFAVLDGRLSRYDAVLEIGANVGLYTVYFASRLAGRPVFAFEPSPEAYRRLLRNLDLNGAASVRAFNQAVARTAGRMPFYEPRGHLTNGSLFRDFAASFADAIETRLVEAVDGERVADLLRPYRRVLLKIDVEGAEAEVLQALEPFIVSTRPDIVIEVLERDEDALNHLEFIGRLYQRFLITDQGLAPAATLRASARFRDYLLLPDAADATA